MDAMDVGTAKRCFGKLKELLVADADNSDKAGEDGEDREDKEGNVEFNNNFTKKVHE